MTSKIQILLAFENIKRELRVQQHTLRGRITRLQSTLSESEINLVREELHELMSLEARCKGIFSKFTILPGPNVVIPDDIRKQVLEFQEALSDNKHKEILNEVLSK